MRLWKAGRYHVDTYDQAWQLRRGVVGACQCCGLEVNPAVENFQTVNRLRKAAHPGCVEVVSGQQPKPAA